MDQPPSLKLGASAKGQRMRYDATLGVQMQVQLHRTSMTVGCHVPGGAGEVPVQACLDWFGAGTGQLERVQAVRTSSAEKQEGMHGGFGLRGHMALAVAWRSMAEEQLQQSER
jgi:hypothetical protein